MINVNKDRILYGRFVNVITKDGNEMSADDWRWEHANKPGMICLGEIPLALQTEKHDSIDMLLFFCYAPDNISQPYLKTSLVKNYEYVDGQLIAYTLNSIYYFDIVDELTDDQKEDLTEDAFNSNPLFELLVCGH